MNQPSTPPQMRSVSYAFLIVGALWIYSGCSLHPAPPTPGLQYEPTNGGYAVSKGTARSTDVVIPAEWKGRPVIKIADGAFREDGALKSIVIPPTVTAIGELAFNGCAGLTSIRIPDSVTVIGAAAFAGADLRAVTVPNKVSTIAEDTFADDSQLNRVKIGRSVTSIGEHAFYGTALNSIKIPDSVVSIGRYAFMITPLRRVRIGRGVKTIGVRAFESCPLLAGISVARGNSYFASRRGVLFNKSFTKLVQAPEEISGTYTVPSTVVTIGNSSFEGSRKLTHVVIPDSVISIEPQAFSSTGLTTLTIPESVTTIAEFAFSGCDKLSRVKLPESIVSIGKGAFDACPRLARISIPNGVKSIGTYAFAHTSLTSVTLPSSVTRVGKNAFMNRHGVRIYRSSVPGGSVAAKRAGHQSTAFVGFSYDLHNAQSYGFVPEIIRELKSGDDLIVGTKRLQGFKVETGKSNVTVAAVVRHGKGINWQLQISMPSGWIGMKFAQAAEDGHGNIYLIGKADVAPATPPNDFDTYWIVVVKVNANGRVIWERGFTARDYGTTVRSATVDSLGRLLLLLDGSALQVTDLSLWCVSKEGRLLWRAPYVTTDRGREAQQLFFPAGLSTTPSGSILVFAIASCSTYAGTSYFPMVDGFSSKDGSLQWEHVFRIGRFSQMYSMNSLGVTHFGRTYFFAVNVLYSSQDSAPRTMFIGFDKQGLVNRMEIGLPNGFTMFKMRQAPGGDFVGPATLLNPGQRGQKEHRSMGVVSIAPDGTVKDVQQLHTPVPVRPLLVGGSSPNYYLLGSLPLGVVDVPVSNIGKSEPYQIQAVDVSGHMRILSTKDVSRYGFALTKASRFRSNAHPLALSISRADLQYNHYPPWDKSSPVYRWLERHTISANGTGGRWINGGTISDSSVRLRTAPTLRSRVITLMSKGTEVKILDKGYYPVPIQGMNAPWFHVKLANGTEGWAYGAFVKVHYQAGGE